MPPRRNGLFWVACVAVVALVAVAVGMVIGRLRSPDDPAAQQPAAPSPTAASPTSAQPPVDAALVKELLLPASKMNNILFSSGLDVTEEGNYFNATAEPPDCASVFAPATRQAYEGTGWTGSWGEELTHPDAPADEAWKDNTTQAVVTFPSDTEATAYIEKESGRWSECQNTIVKINDARGPAEINIDDPTPVEGVLTISFVIRGQTGWGCQRGLAARRNVVIDVRTCDYAGSTVVPQIVNEIGKRVEDA